MTDTSEALGKLVAQAQQIAPEAWAALVRQQVIEGWVYSAASLVTITALVFAAHRVWRMKIEEDLRIIPIMITGLLLLFALIPAASGLVPGVLQACTPEVHAARELMGAVR